jgi:ribonuclease HI
VKSDELRVIDVKEGSTPRKFKTSIGKMNEMDYLHHRWGHPHEKAIREGAQRGTVTGTLVDEGKLRSVSLSFCPDCIRGKMTDIPAKLSETDYGEAEPMEFMATDSKGPLPVASKFGRYKYFDLFTYKSSHWTSVKFKKVKNEVEGNMAEELSQTKKIGQTVRHVQTDDDVLYRSSRMKKIFDDFAINKRTTVPYHHSSNGWIERQMRTIMEKARTIMLIYNCPLSFWAEAISCATYLYNRTPLAILDWKTPYEIVHKEKPDISNLVPFYAPGLVFLSPDERNNQFSPRAIQCRMVGYDDESKNGYVVYIPELGTKKRTVNCRFKEEVDISLRYDEDENRDLGRFKMTDDDQHSIEDAMTFFENVEEIDYPFEDNESDAESTSSLMTLADELELPPEPKSIEEALTGPWAEQWQKAIDAELTQLIETGTILVMDYVPNEPIAKMRLLFQISFDNDFNVKFKARIVLCGYSQIYGVNYLETYSPTVSKASMKLALTYMLKHAMTIRIGDVKGAFLEGENDYVVYGRLPAEIFPKGTGDIVVNLLRSIYGEKQAAYVWYMKFKKILCEYLGFEVLLHDESIFVQKNEAGEIIIMVVVYVDDLLIGAYHEEVLDLFKEEMEKYIKELKFFKDISKYLGMNLIRNGNTMFLNQKTYIQSIYNEMSATDQLRIRKRNYPISPTYDLVDDDDKTKFNLLSFIGKLRYIVDSTRSDGLVALGILSEGGAEANWKQEELCFKVFSYLYTTITTPLKLFADKGKDLKLFCFCDASHNIGNGQARVGGVFYLGFDTGAFFTCSKKETTHSHSAMEAEVKGIDHALQSIIHFRNVLEEFGYKQLEPTSVYTDSEATVEFFKHYKNSKKLRHLLKLLHGIRTAINERIIKLVFIKSCYNVADGLTKLLSEKPFNQFSIWILNGYTEMELGNYLEESISENIEKKKDKGKR